MENEQIKLHLGCGKKKISGFINIDVNKEVEPDMVYDTSNVLPWENDVDLIYSSHNLEHYKRKDLELILKNWWSALKEGGILRLSVPDFEAICKHYLYHRDLSKLQGLLHGGLRNEFDIHYVSFDFKSLKKLLLKVGFKSVKRYDRSKTEHAYIDDYSAATLSPAFSKDGLLMSLNIEAIK